MIKAVLDTNALISGLIWEGTPKKCLDKYRFDNSYQLIFSPELVHEFRVKLLDKFHLGPKVVSQWVKAIREYAIQVLPSYTTRICRDVKDNMILDTAIAGRANFIVTGDKDLLTLGKFQKVEIVSPKSFLTILQKIIK